MELRRSFDALNFTERKSLVFICQKDQQIKCVIRCDTNRIKTMNEHTNTRDQIYRTKHSALTNGSVSFHSILNEWGLIVCSVFKFHQNKTVKSTVTSKSENVSSLILFKKKVFYCFSVQWMGWVSSEQQKLSKYCHFECWSLLNEGEQKRFVDNWQKKGKLDRFVRLFVIVSMFQVPCCLVKWISSTQYPSNESSALYQPTKKRDKNKTFSLFVLLSIERRSNYMFFNIVYWFKLSHASETLAFAIHNVILFVSAVNNTRATNRLPNSI